MVGKGRSAEEVEAERVKMLDELKAGRIEMVSTPEREIALMFMGLEEVTNTLFHRLRIQCVLVPDGSKLSLVLSDHPVAHYEPTPKTPESGAGHMSSPNSQTWVPLDPKFGLLLSPQQPQVWEDIEATDDEVDELKLLSYAWAAEAIYGRSEEGVTSVRRTAKQKPALPGEFRYRPPRVWVTRSDVEGGVHEFTSRLKGQTVKRKLYVSDEAMAEARREPDRPRSNRPQA